MPSLNSSFELPDRGKTFEFDGVTEGTWSEFIKMR